MKKTDVDEIYETIKEREERKEGDTLTQIPQSVKVWLAILTGALILFAVMDYISPMMVVLSGLGILVALKFIYGDVTSGRELTERELAAILLANIRYEQTTPTDGAYRIDPILKVKVERYGRRVRYNGVPEERKFLVSFFNRRTNRTEWWEYAVDLFTGDTCKSDQLYGGPRQFDSRDYKVIVSEDIKDKKRTYAELGIRPRMPRED